MSTIITPPPTGNPPPARLVPAPRGTNGVAALVAQLHDGRNFRRRLRKHGHVRAVLLDDKRVALVHGQIRLRIQHPIRTEQLPQLIGKIGGLDRIHN